MKNVQKDTPKTLEVLESDKKTEGTTPSVGTAPVAEEPNKRAEIENTLNYLNANYSLLQAGLFVGKDSNLLIQVKAWLENQQKALQLQMAKIIASEGK